MEKIESSSSHHEDENLQAFFKIFGQDGNDAPVVPPLPLSQLGQHMAQLSRSNQFSLSHLLGGNTPVGSTSRPPHMRIELLPTPSEPQGMVHEGMAWVTQLMVQMEALSRISDETQGELIAKVPSLDEANTLAKQETQAHQKALSARRWRTSMYSAFVMYWLTFGLGKVVGNSFGAVMVAAGMPAASVYAPLFTMLGVPFMQVIFGEPYGGALRGAGVSYGSPDQGAYINYQTAHALQIRAWLEGNPADVEKYRKIMNGIVDGLIKREKEKKLDGGSRIPKRLRSNASVPERHNDGTVKPGHTDPSRAVIGAARTRSFITDEVPVHTFTVLNGMSGAAGLFWKLFMGGSVTRVTDMAAHTILGSIAMVSMFEWQNVWRAKYQGVPLSDGGHPAVLKAKREAARVTLALWRERCWDAMALIKKIEDMQGRIEVYLRTHDDTHVHWAAMQSYDATLTASHRQLSESLKGILAAERRAKKKLAELDTRATRANQVAKLAIKSMVGESAAPEPWLDGAPMTIRSISRVLGYITVLGPSAAQAILLGMSLMEYDRQLENARQLATSQNMVLAEDGLNVLGLSSDLAAVALATVSTVAMNAIVSWTSKTLYGLPMWEFGIHGIAGMAKRAMKETRKCLGLAPDAALEHAPEAGEDVENPVQPADESAYSEQEESLLGDEELPPLPRNRYDTSSSSSDY